MAEFEQEWLQQYKSLETPKDIMGAVIGLSGQENGAVMVRLENDIRGSGIWFHAKVLEDEVEGARKGYPMLMYSKLYSEIKDNSWKIKEIEPLEIDEHGRDYRTDKFSQEHHCAKADMRNSDFPYAGKYVDLPGEINK